MSHARTQLVVLAVCGLALMLNGCGDDGNDTRESGGAGASADSMAHYDGGSRPGNDVTRIVPAAQQSPKPTGPLPADASCVTSQCHATLVAADHVHAPVGTADCAACHLPDTGEHHYPLARAGNETCTFCHAPFDTQKFQHEPVQQAGCTSCHDPHRSNTNYLLNRPSVGALCQSCHQLPLDQRAHSAYAKGECTVCHQPHQSNAEHLLRGGAGRDHCLSCHDDIKQKLASSDMTHGPVTTDCVTCHSPHTSPFSYLLTQPIKDNCLSCHEDTAKHIAQAKVKHGAIEDDGSCVNCHDAHAATHPKLMKLREDKLCVSCHYRPIKVDDERTVGEIATTLGRKYLHGPVRSGDCSSCHDAHGSAEAELLRQPFPETFYTSYDIEKYKLCFGCHSPDLIQTEKTTELTGFRDGDRNLHYVHVHRDDKGRTCRTCHAVHGSDLPRHMATSVPFEGSSWAMPIRFKMSDDGGSCAPGCHEPMQYHRSAGGAP